MTIVSMFMLCILWIGFGHVLLAAKTLEPSQNKCIHVRNQKLMHHR